MTDLEVLSLLQKLDLGYKLSEEDMSKLSYIDRLKLSSINSLPQSISVLTGLKTLDLSHTQLWDITALSDLKSLTYLNLSWTNVKEIRVLSELTSLTDLDLSWTQINNIDVISELTSLKRLYLWETQVKDISALSELFSLTNLGLNGTLVSDINALKKVTAITNLGLGRTQVSNINALSELINLTNLGIGNTPVSDISNLRNLINLENLDLGDTDVSNIDALRNLINLRDLNLCNTRVSNISALKNLTRLINLNLNGTNVNDISALSNMSALTHLSLCRAHVKSIDILSELKALQKIELKNSTICSIPESILKLGLDFIVEDTSVRRPGIYIYGIDLTEQPSEIFQQTREVIIEYFKSNKATTPINECKVVFLGDGGVGKSLIINRLMNECCISDDFDGNSTPGVHISSKKYPIGDKKIELHFWDFGGQAIMHSMHRLFLTKRTMYVVVTNARDNKANEQAEYWIRNIKSFANGTPVFLIINKKDQNPFANVNETSLRKEYPELKCVRIVSALNDSKNTFKSEIQDIICKIISEMDTVYTRFSKSWISLMKDLQKMPKYYITSSEFYSLCKKNGIVTKEDLLDRIIGWYTDLGVCFYSKTDPFSREYMVLKPRWLLNALYILIFNGRKYAKNGIISENCIYMLICEAVHEKDLMRVYEDIDYKAHEIQYIINVLLGFELIYSMGDKHYFIPMLCDENEPDEISAYLSSKAYHIYFEYDYLPENVLQRFMVRHGNELNTEKVWKTGAVIERKRCGWEAMVQIKGDKLNVYAKSEDNQTHPINSYLEMIRESVYSINSSMGLQADEYITYQEDGKKDCFKYSRLIAMRNMGMLVDYSEILRKSISIDEILGIINKADETEMEKRLTEGVVDQMLSVLFTMSERCVDFSGRGEVMLTSDFQDSIGPVLNAKYDMQIAREYTMGRAKKMLGETDLYFYSYRNGKKRELFILENKVIEKFSIQYHQIMGYLNPNFIAGITLSINKNKGWEEAFNSICNILKELQDIGDVFAPIFIERVTGTNGTQYVKTEHIVPETNQRMPMYHLVLQLSDGARQKVAEIARK